jgi:hypothetical protein
MPTLFLTCHHCEKEFPTPIAVTEAGLHDVLITGMVHLCPHCGKVDQYYTADYHVPTELVEQMPKDPTPMEPAPDAAEELRIQENANKLAGYAVVATPTGRKPQP